MLLHDLLINQALNNPEKKALGVKKVWMTYQELSALSQQYSKIFCRLSMLKGQRIAVYLPKNFEAVISYFATSLSGGIFVPVNPILKARQVEHILSDCNASVLITNKARFKQLNVKDLIDLKYIILTDGLADVEGFDLNQHVINWQNLRDITDTTETDINMCLPDLIDTDIAAIFYTSGSTGNAKGVVLSHRNLVMGANSVASYLPCLTSDIMLAV